MSDEAAFRAALMAAVDLIERFVGGAVQPWEWDDFTSTRSRHSSVEALRAEAGSVCDDFPRAGAEEWCSEAGRQRLLEIAARVRAEMAA